MPAKTVKRRPAKSIARLAQDVDDLRGAVVALQTESPVVVPIHTLAPAPFELIGEIKAVVRHTGDDYIASFVDANVNATGATTALAIENLKDRMVSLYLALKSLPTNKLGKWPTKQLAVLKATIKRRR